MASDVIQIDGGVLEGVHVIYANFHSRNSLFVAYTFCYTCNIYHKMCSTET